MESTLESYLARRTCDAKESGSLWVEFLYSPEGEELLTMLARQALRAVTDPAWHAAWRDFLGSAELAGLLRRRDWQGVVGAWRTREGGGKV
jgi:hypothetical protein